jgi:Second Messenger Oligonucleotide or Dinucleotide Synthetase domain
MYADQRTVMKNVQLVGVLERMCQGLELTDSQFELAKSRYEGVGRWLADAEDLLIRTVAIYLQGSTAIGTTVKPIGSNEHDVDLVAHVSEPDHIISPPALKAAIGNRLRANGHYARILEEMGRCWRLNYANEFHLDITPSIPNPICGRGGELVPDKEMRDWSASNPKGYKALFLERAKLIPQMRLMKGRIAADSAGSHVEPYPKQVGFKGILPRTVQLAKRHRDIHFQNFDPCLAPISVIITTLTSRSYEFCVRNRIYDSELDLLCDVIRCMPFFIQIDDSTGRRRWFIWNETTDNENFAEKWNADPRRAQAFYSWHGHFLADLESLTHIEGLDMLAKQLGGAFGRDPAAQALDGMTESVSTARRTNRLVAAPALGLGVSASSVSTPVRANTFFGSDD